MLDNISPGAVIAIIGVGGGMAIGLIHLVGSLMSDILRSKHQEESRREIAAYVAEGSMTPQEGERLMNAGRSPQAGGAPRPSAVAQSPQVAGKCCHG